MAFGIIDEHMQLINIFLVFSFFIVSEDFKYRTGIVLGAIYMHFALKNVKHKQRNDLSLVWLKHYNACHARDTEKGVRTEHNCERHSSSKHVFWVEKRDIQAVKKQKIHCAKNTFLFF